MPKTWGGLVMGRAPVAELELGGEGEGCEAAWVGRFGVLASATASMAGGALTRSPAPSVCAPMFVESCWATSAAWVSESARLPSSAIL
eukprot:2192502-Pyramimonas_sp.AAC.1